MPRPAESTRRIADQVHDRLLQHPNRALLVSILRRAPGLTAAQLRRALGMAHNTAVYHLHLLERKRVLVAVEAGRRRIFFARDGPFLNGDKVLVGVLRHERLLALARLVCSRPGLTHGQIRAELGWTPSTTTWHLRRLTETGILLAIGKRRPVSYEPGPSARRVQKSDFQVFRAWTAGEP